MAWGCQRPIGDSSIAVVIGLIYQGTYENRCLFCFDKLFVVDTLLYSFLSRYDLCGITSRRYSSTANSSTKRRTEKARTFAKASQKLEKPPSEQLNPLEKLQEDPEARCIEITTIVFKGATLLSEAQKKSLTSPYRNKCLSLTDINNLLRDVTNAYIEKGYTTTRAALPQQNLSDGILTILVVEGTIESIKFKDETSFSSRKLLFAFPGVTDSILNIRDIEQGLDQLNRLPSNNATVKLLPGETQGTTKVVIHNEEKKSWRVSAGLDNSGQESTGELQYSLGFEKDNLLGCNDLLTLSYGGDYDSALRDKAHKSQSMAVLYSLGAGYWTFTGSWNNFDYSTSLKGDSWEFSSKGTTTTTHAGVDYVAYRDSERKTSLGTGLARALVHKCELQHETCGK